MLNRLRVKMAGIKIKPMSKSHKYIIINVIKISIFYLLLSGFLLRCASIVNNMFR